MFGSEILEVAIGVIFVFLLVSIICTAVREGIETRLKTRSAYLEQAVRELLHDRDAKGLTASIYTHPLVHALYPGEYKPKPTAEQTGILARGDNLPSYIPSRNFATALMDIAARGPVTQPGNSGPNAPMVTAESIRANIRNIQNPAVQRVLLTALDEAKNDLDRARNNVENWFDSAMDRVSGQYKRASQKIIFYIGIAIAILLNVDTLRIARFLYVDDAARAAIVARAERAVASGDSVALRMTSDQARAAMDSLNLPVGWTHLSFRPAPDTAELRFWRDSLGRVAARKAAAAATPAAPAPAATPPPAVTVPVLLPTATRADTVRPDTVRVDTARPAGAADTTRRQVAADTARAAASRQDSVRALLRADSARLEAAARDSARPRFAADPGAWSAHWARTLGNIFVFALFSLPGWLITAAAATLGAPFWFDVLNKVMVIRSTVKPHEKSPPEASEDRQNKTVVAPAATTTAATTTAVTTGTAGTAATPGAAGAAGTAGAGAAAPAAVVDDEEHLEGCGIQGEEETLDEELPPAEGGVA